MHLAAGYGRLARTIGTKARERKEYVGVRTVPEAGRVRAILRHPIPRSHQRADACLEKEARLRVAAPSRAIEGRILILRGEKVLLDRDLAALYEVETKALNRAVRRNAGRFPPDFMFALSRQEVTNLKYQFGTSSQSHGGRRTLPLAFTEHGVAMLSSVLRSKRAIEINIAIMRAFARLRELASSHKDVGHRLDRLERKYDRKFRVVFAAIRREVIAAPEPPRRQIGFLRLPSASR